MRKLSCPPALGGANFITALGKASAGSAILAALPPALTPTPRRREQPVTVFVFGGAWRTTRRGGFGEPFTQQTGIPVRYQEPYTLAKLRAMHEAKAQQIDCASVQGGEMSSWLTG